MWGGYGEGEETGKVTEDAYDAARLSALGWAIVEIERTSCNMAITLNIFLRGKSHADWCLEDHAGTGLTFTNPSYCRAYVLEPRTAVPPASNVRNTDAF